jgi:predicted TIM-barrel fold metal-dependent hydrolase
MLVERSPSTLAWKKHLADTSLRVGHDLEAELGNLGDTRIAAMDAAGIDLQVMSFTQPGCERFEAETAIPMARDANDRVSEAVKAHPDRFAAFAALPTASPTESAKELERAVKRLGLKGALINGLARGSFLDDRKYWDIFACAEALDVPVYLHPALPLPGVTSAYFDGFQELASAPWGFTIETGVHFLRLVFAGVFDAYPGLKIILGHLGEALPFLMHRIHMHTYQAAEHRGLKKTPMQYLQDHLIVTTSGNFFTPAFLCANMALGADHILFSVDWPYEKNTSATEFLRALPISEQDREKVAHLNAERLLRV